jgi:hypothetical protein
MLNEADIFYTHRKANIMATDKLFTVVGTSKLNGETKVRFATDIMRTKVLQKHGHTEIVLVELDTAMTKLDAVNTIKGGDEFQSAAQQAAIADYLDAKAPKEKTVKSAPKAKVAAPKATKARATAKVADTSDMEDAPF